MMKRLQGLIAGVLIGATITGGAVFAKSGREMVEALYNNIKIYVDGVKIQPKDATGKTVEPFIYNGTTYLPVRAVGEALGKTVTWDGETQSVYLGEKPGDAQYLMDVCPPYQGHHLEEYPQSSGDFFMMGGKQYSNGFAITHTMDGFALINLDGKYSTMELDIGYIPRSYSAASYSEYTVSFIVDGKTVKTYNLDAYTMPQKITVPLNNGLQLKICTSDNFDYGTGFANIILK